jgi:hypothetical protein
VATPSTSFSSPIAMRSSARARVTRAQSSPLTLT